MVVGDGLDWLMWMELSKYQRWEEAWGIPGGFRGHLGGI